MRSNTPPRPMAHDLTIGPTVHDHTTHGEEFPRRQRLREKISVIIRRTSSHERQTNAMRLYHVTNEEMPAISNMLRASTLNHAAQ